MLLLAHMDTVYEEGEAAQRPFTISTVDGAGARVALGPGVVDCKGNVALIAVLLVCLCTMHQGSCTPGQTSPIA